MEIKLTILAKDVLENDYLNSNNCPITRALQRAGFKGWEDCGTEIQDENDKSVITDENATYRVLQQTVMGMYRAKDKTIYTNKTGVVKSVPIEDFEHLLIF